MKKAVLYGIRDLRLEEIPEPKPGKSEVKIKVKYCGICGSDLHEYLHGPFSPTSFGHEGCGEIVEIGEEVKSFRVGDKVITFQNGAFAEYVICPEEKMINMLPNMSWEQAAVIEPLSGAAYAIEKGGVEATDTVLIVGAGPVGLLTMLGLKAIGVREIYVAQRSERRRKKAEELGATHILNPLEVKIPARIKELTGGRRVDVAIEAVGTEASLKDCLASVRHGGKVIVQGIFMEEASFHMLALVTRETTLIGVCSINPKLAISWIEEKGLMPESIITKIIPLAEISSGGFEILSGKTNKEIKVLVAPW